MNKHRKLINNFERIFDFLNADKSDLDDLV